MILQKIKKFFSDVYFWVKEHPFYTLALFGALAALSAFTAGAVLAPVFYGMGVSLGIYVGASFWFTIGGWLLGNYLSNTFLGDHARDVDERMFRGTLTGVIFAAGFVVAGFFLLSAVPALALVFGAATFMIAGAGLFAGLGALAQKLCNDCYPFGLGRDHQFDEAPAQNVNPYPNPHLAQMVQDNANDVNRPRPTVEALSQRGADLITETQEILYEKMRAQNQADPRRMTEAEMAARTAVLAQKVKNFEKETINFDERLHVTEAEKAARVEALTQRAADIQEQISDAIHEAQEAQRQVRQLRA